MSKALIINVLYDNAKNPLQMSSGHLDFRHCWKAAVALREIMTANRSSRVARSHAQRAGHAHDEDEAILIDSHPGLWASHASNSPASRASKLPRHGVASSSIDLTAVISKC